jgi:pimeloyl-ACP methyl ester carboxylesterase
MVTYRLFVCNNTFGLYVTYETRGIRDEGAIMGDVRDGSTDRRIELSSGPLHFGDVGEGPPIVFIHGYPTNRRLWEPIASRLEDRYRCISPDLPLGGHSEPMRPDADLSIHGIARLISELLAELELEDVTVAGNDAGGAITQVLVTERPERIGRFVLTNCDCFEKFPPRLFKPLVLAARSRFAYRVIVRSLQFGPIRRSPLAFGWLNAQPVDDALLRSFAEPSGLDPRIREDGRKFLVSSGPPDTLAAAGRLPELRFPGLLAWGTDDHFFTLDDARRLDALIPDSRIVEIAGASVFTPLDKPDEVASAIADFVGA